MLILGIESSCDETAAAVVRDGSEVLSNVVSSQIALHADYGGVVPELAAREHSRNVGPVVERALRQSGTAAGDLDAVAVTSRPGLIPCLLVGLNYGKGMALAGGLPLLAVNHFTAHVYSCLLEHPDVLRQSENFPLLALVVSGGHTSLLLVEADGRAEVVGRTIDDAAGEAFDKGAKILGLGYPGGPLIERAAAGGDGEKFRFPRGLTGGGGKPVRPEDRFNFSFSGVKTALLYRVRELAEPPTGEQLSDLAASYQEAIVEVLARKTLAAAQKYRVPTVLVSGGVACNRALRERLQASVEAPDRRLLLASPTYCTDNAAMVAGIAFHDLRHGLLAGLATDAAARLETRLKPVSFAPHFRGNRAPVGAPPYLLPLPAG